MKLLRGDFCEKNLLTMQLESQDIRVKNQERKKGRLITTISFKKK
jgi:translation initiation factor 1 (eIF-1/SUI1)